MSIIAFLKSAHANRYGTCGSLRLIQACDTARYAHWHGRISTPRTGLFGSAETLLFQTTSHRQKQKAGTGQSTSPLLAIEALKSQVAYTRMGRQHQIDVHLREFGRTRRDECTFVFVPRLTARNGKGDEWYSPGSFSGTWNNILRRSGIPHRKSYESRHTYACWALSAGANPNFIAAQMGHTSAQMVYSVYGKWMTDNNDNQLAILNANFGGNAPQMPHAQNE